MNIFKCIVLITSSLFLFSAAAPKPSILSEGSKRSNSYQVKRPKSGPCYYNLSLTKYGKRLIRWGEPVADSTALNARELALMKKLLKGAVKKYNKEWHCCPGNQMTFSNYAVQYIVYKDATGQKMVWINAFCKDFDEDDSSLHTNMATMMDGGQCSFKTRIDISKKKVGPLKTNGVA